MPRPELVIFDLTGTRNIGSLPAGDFDQQVYGVRALFNVSPDLQLTSFVQYDDAAVVRARRQGCRWDVCLPSEIEIAAGP